MEYIVRIVKKQIDFRPPLDINNLRRLNPRRGDTVETKVSHHLAQVMVVMFEKVQQEPVAGDIFAIFVFKREHQIYHHGILSPSARKTPSDARQGWRDRLWNAGRTVSIRRHP